MIKRIIALESEDLKGLMRVRNEFRFVNQADMIRMFVKILYPKSTVVLIYDSKKAFEVIPKLTIKKRDDFSSYMMGTMSDMVFVEFDSTLTASDWAFSFPTKSGIHWEIYMNAMLIRNEKGKIKPPKPIEKEESDGN
jgi:hypothetical protein